MNNQRGQNELNQVTEVLEMETIMSSEMHIAQLKKTQSHIYLKDHKRKLLRHIHQLSLPQHLRYLGFPGNSNCKESSCNAGDPGLILSSGRSPGEGDGYLLLYSSLENSIDKGAWQTTSPWCPKESDTTEQLMLTVISKYSSKHPAHLKVKETESPSVCLTLCHTMNTGVGSCSLLQGIFPTWRSNSGLPHCRKILYQLSHKGSPFKRQHV